MVGLPSTRKFSRLEKRGFLRCHFRPVGSKVASLEGVVDFVLLGCFLTVFTGLLGERRGDGLAVELLQHFDRGADLLGQKEGAGAIRLAPRGVELTEQIDRPLHAVSRRRHFSLRRALSILSPSSSMPIGEFP